MNEAITELIKQRKEIVDNFFKLSNDDFAARRTTIEAQVEKIDALIEKLTPRL